MDLENRVAELEKRVGKLERINKIRLIFNIVTIVVAFVLILGIIYFIGKFYSSLLEGEILSFMI
jgi:hypothetical protein